MILKRYTRTLKVLLLFSRYLYKGGDSATIINVAATTLHTDIWQVCPLNLLTKDNSTWPLATEILFLQVARSLTLSNFYVQSYLFLSTKLQNQINDVLW